MYNLYLPAVAWRVRACGRAACGLTALCLLRNVCLYSDDGVCGVWCPCSLL